MQPAAITNETTDSALARIQVLAILFIIPGRPSATTIRVCAPPLTSAAVEGHGHVITETQDAMQHQEQQIAGALGVAIAATVAFTHTKTLLASGHSPAQAATSASPLASG